MFVSNLNNIFLISSYIYGLLFCFKIFENYIKLKNSDLTQIYFNKEMNGSKLAYKSRNHKSVELGIFLNFEIAT